MVQIKQKDKQTGIIYVYESQYKYDKKTKQSRYTNRKLIGHIDPKTNKVVPNRPTRKYRKSNANNCNNCAKYDKAIDELKKENKELQSQIDKLKAEFENLQKLIK